ncbi:hypothetical protein KC19_12G060500 [Ceratodon purpureus]|uniref:Uncharacterized protein n=1 Tax=Ceratodon purpureus TaxID=3225 RepID=A0A8T0G6G9_CERPU|nr:hypothetical protein KC19_12G060500 [Ceratodon purpureus]
MRLNIRITQNPTILTLSTKNYLNHLKASNPENSSGDYNHLFRHRKLHHLTDSPPQSTTKLKTSMTHLYNAMWSTCNSSISILATSRHQLHMNMLNFVSK